MAGSESPSLLWQPRVRARPPGLDRKQLWSAASSPPRATHGWERSCSSTPARITGAHSPREHHLLPDGQGLSPARPGTLCCGRRQSPFRGAGRAATIRAPSPNKDDDQVCSPKGASSSVHAEHSHRSQPPATCLQAHTASPKPTPNTIATLSSLCQTQNHTTRLATGRRQRLPPGPNLMQEQNGSCG